MGVRDWHMAEMEVLKATSGMRAVACITVRVLVADDNSWQELATW